MAELASSMSGFILPNNFQPLDADSESDCESTDNEPWTKVPFSSHPSTPSSGGSPQLDVESCSPNVTVEYLPQSVPLHSSRTESDNSWAHMHDSSVLTNDSGYTPNSSAFSDLSSSGGFSSCSLSSENSSLNLSHGRSLRTNPQSAVHDLGMVSGVVLQPVTPTKPPDENLPEDPLTPTANLKMLLSAMSPEIRNMENMKKKKARLFDTAVETSSEHTLSHCENRTVFIERPSVLGQSSSSGHESILNSSQEDTTGEDSERNNRKSKSLGLLCQKFLTKYPDYPADGKAMDISLDQISKDLSVERRRIYDIVNVLESVEMVSRRAKNRYLWHGRTHIHRTLAKLKCLGQRQKFAEHLAHLQSRLEDGSLCVDENRSPVYGADRVVSGEVAKQPLQDISNFLRSPTEAEMRKDSRENWEDDTKRDKTLGVMSQKFIMLFLVCKDRIISLDVAARILKGDQNYQIGENAKFKTKVRRLYDIANILTSLKLIDKIHVQEGRGRKPAFRWIGPDPDTSSVDWSELPSGTKPTQKHSYFALPPVTAESWTTNPTHKQLSETSKFPLEKVAGGKSRVNWSRNASFSAICEVAEQERRKYSSAPNSPVKTEEAAGEKEKERKENAEIKVKLEDPSPKGSTAKKELQFFQEFEALRTKYPSCVSRLFSSVPSHPSPLTSDPGNDPGRLQQQSPPAEGGRGGAGGLEVAPRGASQSPTAGEGGSNASKTAKPQKVVYVQRLVPLLSPSTVAAVQASNTPQTTDLPSRPSPMGAASQGPSLPSTTTTTTGSSEGPRPVVMPPSTPGSVIQILPVGHQSWVQLPSGGGPRQRSVISLNTRSPVVTEAGDAVTITSKAAHVGSTSPVVTIIRRSKRPVKLALDKEFEYPPLTKKTKAEETLLQHEKPEQVQIIVSEPAKNTTVVVAQPAQPLPLPQSQFHASSVPHPEPATITHHPPLEGDRVISALEERNKNMSKSVRVLQETLQTPNSQEQRRPSLSHVKRRLNIDLDKAPPHPSSTSSHARKSPCLAQRKKTSKKMPRCRSLPDIEPRKEANNLQSNGLAVPYLETELLGVRRGEMVKECSKDRSAIEQSVGHLVALEHNYSSQRVKMKFGGKLGSLEKDFGNLPDREHLEKKEAAVKVGSCDALKEGESLCNQEVSIEHLKLDRDSVLTVAEQKISEMGGNAELEDCWLSASFPPPSLSSFATLIQGRCSRESFPRFASRSSSAGSIGELDQWLFPPEAASPVVPSDQPANKLASILERTPANIGQSGCQSTAHAVTRTLSSAVSSPPRLTAVPASVGIALASPRPVLRKATQQFCDSPQHHYIHNASPDLGIEPLFTSTPKSSKPEAATTQFSSMILTDQSDSPCVAGECSTPQPHPFRPRVRKSLLEDLGRLKPLEGDPIEPHHARAFQEEGSQKTDGLDHEGHKIRTSPPICPNEIHPKFEETLHHTMLPICRNIPMKESAGRVQQHFQLVNGASTSENHCPTSAPQHGNVIEISSSTVAQASTLTYSSASSVACMSEPGTNSNRPGSADDASLSTDLPFSPPHLTASQVPSAASKPDPTAGPHPCTPPSGQPHFLLKNPQGNRTFHSQVTYTASGRRTIMHTRPFSGSRKAPQILAVQKSLNGLCKTSAPRVSSGFNQSGEGTSHRCLADLSKSTLHHQDAVFCGSLGQAGQRTSATSDHIPDIVQGAVADIPKPCSPIAVINPVTEGYSAGLLPVHVASPSTQVVRPHTIPTVLQITHPLPAAVPSCILSRACLPTSVTNSQAIVLQTSTGNSVPTGHLIPFNVAGVSNLPAPRPHLPTPWILPHAVVPSAAASLPYGYTFQAAVPAIEDRVGWSCEGSTAAPPYLGMVQRANLAQMMTQVSSPLCSTSTCGGIIGQTVKP